MQRPDCQRWLDTAAGWSRRLADAWLPRGCVLCNTCLGAAQAGLCEPCLHDLPGGDQTARCERCGMRRDGPATGRQCPDCTAQPPAFDRTLVLADYAPPLDRAIVAMKFHGQRAIAVALGEALGRLAAHQAAPDPAARVVAVPLSRERLLQRGFNQSQVIASRVARALRLGCPASPLRRLWHTESQSGLNLQQRHDNVQGAFDCSLAAGRLITGRTVLLVDDVMTTGATFNAAADALKCAGATTVVCLAVARTPQGRLIATRTGAATPTADGMPRNDSQSRPRRTAPGRADVVV